MRFIFNFLTLVIILAILLFIAWGVYTYINPFQPYNPFPPVTLFDTLKAFV